MDSRLVIPQTLDEGQRREVWDEARASLPVRGTLSRLMRTHFNNDKVACCIVLAWLMKIRFCRVCNRRWPKGAPHKCNRVS